MENTIFPKVSICIPTYNQTAYLKILLDSIAGQTFKDYEIIVSDDSTTTDVKKLIDSFSFGEKLRYYHNQPSLGSPSNWNAAIAKASGEFVKIMHHDDAFVDENALGQMVKTIDSNKLDYLFSDSVIENVQDKERNRVHHIKRFNSLKKKPYLLFFGNSIGSPSTSLLRRNVFADMHYDPKYIWLVDIEYYTRLLQRSNNGAAIAEHLILTHDAAAHRLTSSIISDFELQLKEQAMLYNAMYPEAPAITRFFMQVSVARLFFKSKTKNKALVAGFNRVPQSVHLYFSAIKFKPLYFAYYISIRALDVVRKTFIR